MAVSTPSNKTMNTLIWVLSIAVPVVVALLFYAPREHPQNVPAFVAFLPHLHGMLNTATAVALVVGLVYIKKKNIKAHRNSMLIAFTLSSLFLISYVIFHYSVPEQPKFGGEGWVRPVYFFILITHIITSTFIIFFALTSLYLGLTNRIAKHRKFSKFTLPLWLYVAVTGVMVYLFMLPYYNF